MASGNCPSLAESESAHVSLETECGLPHHGGRAHASKANNNKGIEYLVLIKNHHPISSHSTNNHPPTSHTTTTRIYSGASIAVSPSRPLATSAATPSFAEYATTVSTEKARNASATLIVPCADERRPEKGTLSGDRPHWTLMLMRPTTVESLSTKGAAMSPVASDVKIAACWPF